MVPAALAWAILGLVLNLLPISAAALVLAAVYSIFYGIVESNGKIWPRPPGRTWQVPSRWVRGRPAGQRILIWGSALGPGFATRNLYAGFGLLPIAVAAVGSIRAGLALAVAIGTAHGAARALALARDVRDSDQADYLQAELKSRFWRIFDGYALLVIGGLAVMACGYRFG